MIHGGLTRPDTLMLSSIGQMALIQTFDNLYKERNLLFSELETAYYILKRKDTERPNA